MDVAGRRRRHVEELPARRPAAPRRDGDLTLLYADPQRAKDVLGFTAKHSDLENIIRTAWKFHSKQWS